MRNDFILTNDSIDYLEGLPLRMIREINSFELVSTNSILGVLDNNLNEEIQKLQGALPNLSISPIRGIGTKTMSSDNSDLKFKIFNTLGYAFSDGTELAICSNGNNAVEIVSFKISKNKKNKGVDDVIMDYLLSFLKSSLNYIPPIFVMVKNKKSNTESQIEFFKRFEFTTNETTDYYILMKRTTE